MLSSSTARFRLFVWLLIVSFSISSTPHVELLLPYGLRLVTSEAQAAETEHTDQQVPEETSSAGAETSGAKVMTFGEGAGSTFSASAGGEDAASGAGIAPATADISLFTGAVATSIPILVPEGRSKMGPRISLKYNSYQKNSWVGMGWTLDLGSIQQSTKWGLSYDQNGYVATIDGSSVELVRRPEWDNSLGAAYEARLESNVSK